MTKNLPLPSFAPRQMGPMDGELFLERRRGEVLVFDDGRLRNASYDASEGFGLRAVRGDVSGYAHSSEISEAALHRAVQTARLAVGEGGGTLAVGPKRTNRQLYTERDPIADAAFPVKIETLREIDAFARDLDPRVVQVTASVAASHQEIVILRPDGTIMSDSRPMTRVDVSVIVEKDGRREAAVRLVAGGSAWMACLTGDWQRKAREALRIALVNLEAVLPRRARWMLCLAPAGPVFAARSGRAWA